MASAWLPSGQLSDGTLVMGPLKERPANINMVEAVEVDGRTWYVAYCCKELSDAQRQELQAWVRKNLPLK